MISCSSTSTSMLNEQRESPQNFGPVWTSAGESCVYTSPELGNSTGVPVLCTKTRTKVQVVHTHKLNGPKLVCVILFWTGTIRANPMHGCTFASHSESILYLCILTTNLSKKVTACIPVLWSTWVSSKGVPIEQDFEENQEIFVMIFKKV